MTLLLVVAANLLAALVLLGLLLAFSSAFWRWLDDGEEERHS